MVLRRGRIEPLFVKTTEETEDTEMRFEINSLIAMNNLERRIDTAGMASRR
jgi:hypothetical protein